jgi:hypothetical protein
MLHSAQFYIGTECKFINLDWQMLVVWSQKIPMQNINMVLYEFCV